MHHHYNFSNLKKDDDVHSVTTPAPQTQVPIAATLEVSSTKALASSKPVPKLYPITLGKKNIKTKGSLKSKCTLVSRVAALAAIKPGSLSKQDFDT